MQVQFDQIGERKRKPERVPEPPPAPEPPSAPRPPRIPDSERRSNIDLNIQITRGGARTLGAALVVLGALFLLGNAIGFRTGQLIAPFIIASVGLPFYAVYRHDTRHWWALIPAFSMWVIGAFVLMLILGMPAEPVIMFVLLGIGAPFLYVYLRDRKQWWALIPAYSMAYFSVLPALIWVNLDAAFIVTAMLALLGLPFLYVYLRDQKQWWALIPAYTFIIMAGLPTSIGLNVRAELIIAYFMFASAAPFLVVYWRNRQHWWALIPAGVFASAGVVLTLAGVAWLLPVAMIGFGLYLLVRRVAGEKIEERPPSV